MNKPLYFKEEVVLNVLAITLATLKEQSKDLKITEGYIQYLLMKLYEFDSCGLHPASEVYKKDIEAIAEKLREWKESQERGEQ